MTLDPTLDLQISRLLQAPRAAVWQAWNDPALLATWWCPKPWSTEVLAFEWQAGGAFHTLMRGPNGGESDNPGSFLEIVPQERIVFSSLLLRQWRPAPTPWMPMTAIITLADEGAGTRYGATVLHQSAAAREQHEQMGFFEGWNLCIDQLAEVAQALAAAPR
jgi:uncharacterized protein YndB with AHSA1/START domain